MICALCVQLTELHNWISNPSNYMHTHIGHCVHREVMLKHMFTRDMAGTMFTHTGHPMVKDIILAQM